MTQNASHLCNELIKFRSQYSHWSDVRYLGVMAWMMVGMIATGSVNLTLTLLLLLVENIFRNYSALSSMLLLSTGLPSLLSVNQGA